MARPPVVQGYIYRNTYDVERDDTICKIVARASPVAELDFMPIFEVEFGDGVHTRVLGEHLSPWYPV